MVILSNPHNPSGINLDPRDLVEVARRHGHATLVVDESYVDFLPDPGAASVIGADLENLVVLRSPSKFYGIAATRVGVAWCRDRRRLLALLGPRETWPVSGLDATVAIAAMASTTWAEVSRRRLALDGAWLATQLGELGQSVVEDRVGVHYRCVYSERAAELTRQFARHGLGVRALGAAHGVHPGAIRVLAPLAAERELVAEAVHAVRDRQLAVPVRA